MVVKLFFFLLVFSLPVRCLGQVRTITGRIINSKDQQPVKNASVMVPGSDSGTFTNYLGYFRIELAKGHGELLIAHVGYETGKVVIPGVDRFTIKLVPQKVFLEDLELDGFPEEPVPFDKVPETGKGAAGQNAKYSRGWEMFYNTLGNKIIHHRDFVRKSFGVTLAFTINRKGKVSGIEVSPDSVLNKEVILTSFLQLKEWKAAVQHGVSVPQTFTLRISLGQPTRPARPKKGTIKDFQTYIARHLTYPVAAQTKGVEGRVYVQCVIRKDGSLAGVEVLRGIGYGCDKEVVEIVKKFSGWIPARHRGKAARQSIIVPVKFQIGGQSSGPGAARFLLPEGMADNPSEVPWQVLPEIVVKTAKGHTQKATAESKVIRIEMPRFSEDYDALENYIEKHRREIHTPVPPNNMGSRVSLEFMVDAAGNVKDIKVTGSLGQPFDREAVRIYAHMPQWIPAKNDGEPVAMTSVTGAVYFGNISDHNIRSAHTHFERGLEFFDKGKLEKALKQFTRAIEKNPTELNYYFNKAVTLLEMDKPACNILTLIKDNDQDALDLYNVHCQGR